MRRRPIVVTGVNGFVGRHLAAAAAASGVDVLGVGREAEAPAELRSSLADYRQADLRSRWPDEVPRDAVVIHLAGLAAVGASFDRPQDYIDGNSAMITRLCEPLVAAGRHDVRVIGVSTGAVYAPVTGDGRRRELDGIDFSSPYVLSKVLVENQLAYYRRRGLDTVVARPFNHIGPGQGSGFLLPDLAAQLSDLPDDGVLPVGDLSTRRDYTDVRDVVAAYLALAFHDRLHAQVYNVASGTARSGREVLEALCRAQGRAVPATRTDPARRRATDPEVIVGDASRLRAETHWAPQRSFEQSVGDFVAHARGPA